MLRVNYRRVSQDGVRSDGPIDRIPVRRWPGCPIWRSSRISRRNRSSRTLRPSDLGRRTIRARTNDWSPSWFAHFSCLLSPSPPPVAARSTPARAAYSAATCAETNTASRRAAPAGPARCRASRPVPHPVPRPVIPVQPVRSQVAVSSDRRTSRQPIPRPARATPPLLPPTRSRPTPPRVRRPAPRSTIRSCRTRCPSQPRCPDRCLPSAHRSLPRGTRSTRCPRSTPSVRPG